MRHDNLTMQLAVCAAFIICFALYLKAISKKKPFPRKEMKQTYKQIKEGITHAATLTELAYQEDAIDDFYNIFCFRKDFHSAHSKWSRLVREHSRRFYLLNESAKATI